MEEYFTSKIEKNIPHGLCMQFYEPPDLGKNILQPEVSLTLKHI